MIKSLIFDFDGTLADTNEAIVRTFQETFRSMGMPVPTRERVTSTIGLALRDGLKAGMDNLSEEDADEAMIRYRRFFNDIAIPVTKPFPDARETLRRLCEQGYHLTIATSRSHHSLEILAEKIGVAGYFKGMFGAEDVVNHKPAPDLVNLILGKFGFKPEEALVIGDATYDLLMGKGAGCRVCGVTWGNQNREKLATAGPDYIIDSFGELFDILDELRTLNSQPQ